MSRARAAVMTAFHTPLSIDSFPVADPGPGEVLVRITHSGICGTDIHLWKGELPVPLPLIMGHESIGIIEAIGGGPLRDWRGHALAAGDRITWASSISCGECFHCRAKRQPTRCATRKAYGISYPSNVAPHLRGGYAEKMLLRAGTSIFLVPEELSSLSVVGAGCALSTAVHGLERCPVSWGDSVVIQGSGPVGHGAVAVARQSGAGRIIVIGGPEHRLELARSFGADLTISIDGGSTVDSRRQQVLDATGGFGADVVIECAGLPEAVKEGIDLCRDGGRFLVLGQYANAGDILFNPHTITRKQLTIQGSWGFEPRHVDGALRFLALDAWAERFASQVTHRFSLDSANEALLAVRDWRTGKAIIVPEPVE